MTSAHDPSRRRLLQALGAVAAVPVLAVLPAPTAASAQTSARGASDRPHGEGPECLADLIDEGVVTRADLVAG